MTSIKLVALFFLASCNHQQWHQTGEGMIQASLNATGTQDDRKNVQSIISRANCRSPKGAYTTEIQTASGGYTYFKQMFSYTPDPFIAVIQNKTEGVLQGDTARISGELVHAIRGHEFHTMILEADRRFHNFEKPVLVETDTAKLYQVTAKDERDQRCTLFFDAGTKLMTALHTRNPMDTTAIIKITFTEWEERDGFTLPWQVKIEQGGNLYTFRFLEIVFNDPAFKKIKI